MFKPDYYMALRDFRELTLRRLQRFCDQRFISVADYMADPLKFQAGLEVLSFAGRLCCCGNVAEGVHSASKSCLYCCLGYYEQRQGCRHDWTQWTPHLTLVQCT